jgi:protein-S-isoprenylcysteine O-methyltransferase Ste14
VVPWCCHRRYLVNIYINFKLVQKKKKREKNIPRARDALASRAPVLLLVLVVFVGQLGLLLVVPSLVFVVLVLELLVAVVVVVVVNREGGDGDEDY